MRAARLAALGLSIALPVAAQPGRGHPDEETVRVRVPQLDLRVLVRHRSPAGRGAGERRSPILFVHGSSFPSALAFAYRFGGSSWMDDLARRGFDVWAFDFLGYGGSDRYPAMRGDAMAVPPLGRAPVAAEQIAAVVAFIQARARVPRVSIVAHSWGTIPAGLFATRHPDAIDRLVDFGPVAQRAGPPRDASLPAYTFVTEEDQRSRFDNYVPAGQPRVLADPGLSRWGPAYLATDSSSASRRPASVEIPNGPSADIAEAWSGHLAYDPGQITAPVLIVRGEWDVVTTDADAHWLWDALRQAPVKRDVKIAHATHVMHLEVNRGALFDEVAAFLSARTPRVVATAAPGDSIRIAAIGALSGPVSSFGINSRAALTAAIDSINRLGGVRLAGGRSLPVALRYEDGRCDVRTAEGLLRADAASSALAVIGPSCSSVAESLYAVLARDTADTGGLRIPVVTDGAMKAGLARLSRWSFRNTPDERAMYRALWTWVRRHEPALHTVFGGEEHDFAHSHTTWDNIMRPEAEAAGLRLVGTSAWSIHDTLFADPVAAMRAAASDIVVLSAHSHTTCGVLREMRRQGVRPALVVGLTSAASDETIAECGALADGIVAPTSFATVTVSAQAAARAIQRAGGVADLHSAAAWEIMFALREVMESAGVQGRAETVAADREAIRATLASRTTLPGVLGPILRTADRESRKPFVIARAGPHGWRPIARYAADPAEPAP